MGEPKRFSNIRDLLGGVIGRTVLEVTGDDVADIIARFPDRETRESCVYLHLDDGTTLAFKVQGPAGFCYPFDTSR